MGTEEKYRHTEADRHTRGQGRPDREAHTGHSMEAEAEEVTHTGHSMEAEAEEVTHAGHSMEVEAEEATHAGHSMEVEAEEATHAGHSMEAEAEEVTRAGHSTEPEHEAGAYTHAHTHAYTHTHTHSHVHAHTHKNTKAVLDRLARAIGHLEKVRLMVEDGEDCSAVLIQLSAVKSAINNTGKLILKDHMEHCMVEAVKEGDFGAIEELTKAIDQFVK